MTKDIHILHLIYDLNPKHLDVEFMILNMNSLVYTAGSKVVESVRMKVLNLKCSGLMGVVAATRPIGCSAIAQVLQQLQPSRIVGGCAQAL